MNYAHYYMTEDELAYKHKKEIWSAYLQVNKKLDKLPLFQQAWVRKYFPREIEK